MKTKNYIKYYVFRDDTGNSANYRAISLIEFQGTINSAGQSQGHYICDTHEQLNKIWFRTNDNSYPKAITQDQVTKRAYVILLQRTDNQ